MAVVNLEATVPVELAGQRLDQVLPQLFGDYPSVQLHLTRKG